MGQGSKGGGYVGKLPSNQASTADTDDYINMSEVLKNKLSANAKHFRFLNRAETFHRNRKTAE